jgi:hypothetical protein
MNRIEELNCSIVTRNINPCVICLSEHHMTGPKLSCSNVPNYMLGMSYSRTIHQGGGVCIFVRTTIEFIPID